MMKTVEVGCFFLNEVNLLLGLGGWFTLFFPYGLEKGGVQGSRSFKELLKNRHQKKKT